MLYSHLKAGPFAALPNCSGLAPDYAVRPCVFERYAYPKNFIPSSHQHGRARQPLEELARGPVDFVQRKRGSAQTHGRGACLASRRLRSKRAPKAAQTRRGGTRYIFIGSELGIFPSLTA